MTNRVPTYPGRIKLTVVDQSQGIYDMERADVPIQQGTPLNKDTLLNSDVETALNLNENSTPSDAFLALNNAVSQKAPAYTYGTEDVQAGSASPYENGHLHFVYEQ